MSAEPADEPLGERLPEDELALNVAEARIAAKLFGVAAEVVVGRYKLLEMVGRGGMGVVWGAWDPELKRKVAIKLVDPLRIAARDRIVLEARSLAKLSHPNVVPIYDVGIVDDRVYLVMEWVTGDNLRVRQGGAKRDREIVDVYTQAARGLAAVHAAGLVHRDFKPENAIVGTDGRVRVLDFGLARGDGSTTEISGTPRYMAPEQLAGQAATPAVDQYALCVALREALEARAAASGDKPARWLAAIVARGTAEQPEDRFASIDELVHALGRDPARVWRRRILAGAALAVAGTAFVVGRSLDHDTCTEPPVAPALAGAGARIAAHLDELGGFAASERAALLGIFDDNQRKWRVQTRSACVAHERHELTTGMYERRLTCLARAQASLAATAEIVEHATTATFPDARVAAGAVVDPTTCVNVDQSLVPMPAPLSVPVVRTAEAAIERARMFATAARPDAREVAAAARTTAEHTGYAPVLAHGLLVEGRAQMLFKDERARATLDRAMRAGFIAHDDATAVEAFARLAFVSVRGGVPVDGTSVIDAIATRLGPDGTFARLLLLNNLAVVRLASANDPAGGRDLLEAALREWRPGENEDDYELVSIPQNLALAVHAPGRSLELLAQARAAAVHLLGSDHPTVLGLDQSRLLFLDLEHARAQADVTCEKLARLFPQLRSDRVTCEYKAGWLADEAGDAAGAASHFAAAPIDATVDPQRAQIASSMAALSRGSPARELATALEATASSATPDSPWKRALVADAFVAAARGWELSGNQPAALRCWNRARPLLEAIDRPSTARQLARVRTALARGTPDRAAAAGYARDALTWYRSIGGYGSVIAELERFQ